MTFCAGLGEVFQELFGAVVRDHDAGFAGGAKGEGGVVDVLYAGGVGGADGGDVVFFSPGAIGGVVEVEGDVG